MKIKRGVLLTTFLLLLSLLLSSCSTTKRLEKLSQEGWSLHPFLEQHKINSYESSYPIYYNTGAEWNERTLELIEEAEEYILICTFLGVAHAATEPVWSALAQKVAEGVKVYILIDSSSNFQLVPESNEIIQAAYMRLSELGLEVAEYNSLSLSNIFYPWSLFERNHQKYWVVDGELLAIGGVNVNHTSIAWPEGVGNIDSMVEVYSPGALKEVVELFVDTWNDYSPKQLKSSDFSVKESLEGVVERTSLYLVDHHWPRKRSITPIFDALSLYAQDELWLIQGYTFVTPSLLDRLKVAIKRGVKVNVLLSEYSTQEKYELASFYGILDLIDAGINVYMYDSPDGAFLHLKLMVADGKLVTIGSANYNFRSQLLSRELNFLFEDERIGQEALDYIDELLEHTRVVTREEAEQYRTFKGWFNNLLMQVWG
ncbi:MAG: phosphatidylserine/phosphatidylglycerophosphate/cardiolipin synthase family protein [Spirochaetales bacterium]|nr:phosphatidylserine/phosphatidylglycerophosphate/cardiolipin synthase family protein [Spirochaetales bacterium]